MTIDELIGNNAGVGYIAAQSAFHSIENKYGGLCEECGSEQRWDQKHNELVCSSCGLVCSAPSAMFSQLGEQGATETGSVLPNYAHLSDDELDLMIGSKNRKLIRKIGDPKENPALKTLKPFALSELGSKDYAKLHGMIFGRDTLGQPIKVPLSCIRLDSLIKEKPSINEISYRIKFSLEMNPKTKKPKRLLSISSEIVLPKTQQQDPYKLWREQKRVERSYHKHKLNLIADHDANGFSASLRTSNPQDERLEVLKHSRIKITKDIGIDYKAADRALNRMRKKELRKEIIESRAYDEGDNVWLRTTQWRRDLEPEEEARKAYGRDWMKREELVWHPLLPLSEHRIREHIGLSIGWITSTKFSMATPNDSVCGSCANI
ncbi:MAG: hypothetical protein MUO26_00390 [Methanotrichaceae archaeon]|nr:hypothetical protein [Methanotrichaceae archaeon]